MTRFRKTSLLWLLILLPTVLLANNKLGIKDIIFRGDCEKLIIQEINNAHDSVIVVNFLFDYKPIVDALITAKQKGVKIIVLTDSRSDETVMKGKNGQTYHASSVSYMKSNGIDVHIYKRHTSGYGIMHEKFILFDASSILVGSYNFNEASTKYADAMILIENKELYSQFYTEFLRLKNISNISCYKKNKTTGVFFSADKIDDLIISQIRKATDSIIVVHAYFDYKPIADALIEAKKNNIKVVILTDISTKNRQMKDVFSDYKRPLLSHLYSGGIEEIYLYNPGKKMHNKYMLIDDNYFICGSYNLHSQSAIFDEENVVAFQSKELYSKLYDEFVYLKNDADKYTVDESETSKNFLKETRPSVLKKHMKIIAIFSISLNVVLIFLILILIKKIYRAGYWKIIKNKNS